MGGSLPSRPLRPVPREAATPPPTHIDDSSLFTMGSPSLHHSFLLAHRLKHAGPGRLGTRARRHAGPVDVRISARPLPLSPVPNAHRHAFWAVEYTFRGDLSPFASLSLCIHIIGPSVSLMFPPLSAPSDSLASQLSGPSRISSRLAAPNGARRTRSRARRGAPTRLSHLSHTYALRLPHPPSHASRSCARMAARTNERTNDVSPALDAVSLPSPHASTRHPHLHPIPHGFSRHSTLSTHSHCIFHFFFTLLSQPRLLIAQYIFFTTHPIHTTRPRTHLITHLPRPGADFIFTHIARRIALVICLVGRIGRRSSSSSSII